MERSGDCGEAKKKVVGEIALTRGWGGIDGTELGKDTGEDM